jgi:recombination protein RecT
MNRRTPQRQQTNNVQRLVAHLESDEGHQQLQRYAPDDVSKGDVQRLALHLLKQDDDDNLAECTPASLVGSILQAQHLGLDLTMEEAYLVPYGNEAELQVGYQGLVKLAKQSDKIEHVFADVVREGDEFTYKKTLDGTVFEHEPEPFGSGDLRGAYCVVKYINGVVDVERMSKEQIDNVRSKASDYSGAWNDFYAEMAKKSVTRRALKWVDLTPEAGQAIQKTREAFDYDSSDPDRQLEADSSGDEDLDEMFEPDDESEPEQLPEVEDTSTAESEPDDDEAADWGTERRRLGQVVSNAPCDIEREQVDEALADIHDVPHVNRLDAEALREEVNRIMRVEGQQRAEYLRSLCDVSKQPESSSEAASKQSDAAESSSKQQTKLAASGGEELSRLEHVRRESEELDEFARLLLRVADESEAEEIVDIALEAAKADSVTYLSDQQEQALVEWADIPPNRLLPRVEETVDTGELAGDIDLA